MVVSDQQVKKLFQFDTQGFARDLAATKAGLDPKTARKYRSLQRLPSEVSVMDRHWRTRADAFADVWPQLVEKLEVNPGLQVKTLFLDLQRRFPGCFQDGQIRALERRIKTWRGSQGPAKEVFFDQVHHPGRLCASDFTRCSDLGVSREVLARYREWTLAPLTVRVEKPGDIPPDIDERLKQYGTVRLLVVPRVYEALAQPLADLGFSSKSVGGFEPVYNPLLSSVVCLRERPA
jgi:hypothetical protein